MTKQEMIEKIIAAFNDIETYKVAWFYKFIMAKLSLEKKSN